MLSTAGPLGWKFESVTFIAGAATLTFKKAGPADR
jgi:hypothetical protein